ncbi:MAG: biosynthetic-type acetolactate synthase large subunit [Erysipelotrichaceae bacterium]|nr:biosynthetic-type acetolactate synthase large subunit [Erysipelotrichaceae bacterium]MDD3808876.1 biosynthetic-type acetolactate synthase large subunit [Erysipelotrichaceae bacterium]
MELNGSDIIIKCLIEQGVDTIFGYPGGAILNVYDSLYNHSDKINHILTSHEQGAAHAADGYARASGKVGVCFATSGPGATNLVTGIATAFLDSVPLVAITANVGRSLLGKDSFQEIDILGVTMPITKHNFIIKDARDLAPTIRKAFQIAVEGRPGPVLIDVTKNATAEMAEYEPVEPEFIDSRGYTYSPEDIEEALSMIRQSSKPMIFIGGGTVIAGANDELLEFANIVDAPVCDSLMAKGAYDTTRPRYTGMLGMHGTKASNLGVSRCDLLIAIGTRFSDRVIGNSKHFASNAKIIHIDVDAAEINKNIKVDLGIVGDARKIIKDINSLLEQQNHPHWMKEIRDLKDNFPITYPRGLTGPLVIEKVSEMTNNDAIVVTDVGQHQMWAAQFYKFKFPRQLITSGGLGTMGYGLGAALGAKMAKPEKTVINFAGDGCFRMNLNELATASRYNIPIIEIVLNNQVLGMVRQWQDLFYSQRYSATVFDDKVDFCKVAEGLGCKAFKVETVEQLEPAIAAALDHDGPVVIECMIGRDEKVWPMVAPGKAISEVFDQKDLESR